MSVDSKVIENILPLKFLSQASIRCYEDEFETEIEKFDFSVELENGRFIEKCQLVFTLTNSSNTNERIVLEIDYTDNYHSLGSMLASRNSNKDNYIGIVSVNAESESQKNNLLEVAREMTNVEILSEISS